MKNIVAWLSTSSRVSWLEVWKQMHSLLSLLMSTSWWWEEQPQREVEMKVLTDKFAILKEKTKVVYLKTQRQRILFYGIGIERFGGTHLKIFRRERRRASRRHHPKRRPSWAKSLRARCWVTTTWGNLVTSRLYQQSNMGIWRQNVQAQAEHETTFYSPVKAPETQKIVCLLCLRELQCAMLSKENWPHIRWILWEKNTICDLPRLGTAQINE